MENKVSSRQMRGTSNAKTDLIQWGGYQKCGEAPIRSLTPGGGPVPQRLVSLTINRSRAVSIGISPHFTARSVLANIR